MVSPPIYLTGFLEFQDALGKNLSEAYVGQLPAKDVLKKTEDEWNADRPTHRPQQAQERARELQGGHAETQPSGVTPRRAGHVIPTIRPDRLRARPAYPPGPFHERGRRSGRIG